MSETKDLQTREHVEKILDDLERGLFRCHSLEVDRYLKFKKGCQKKSFYSGKMKAFELAIQQVDIFRNNHGLTHQERVEKTHSAMTGVLKEEIRAPVYDEVNLDG